MAWCLADTKPLPGSLVIQVNGAYMRLSDWLSWLLHRIGKMYRCGEKRYCLSTRGITSPLWLRVGNFDPPGRVGSRVGLTMICKIPIVSTSGSSIHQGIRLLSLDIAMSRHREIICWNEKSESLWNFTSAFAVMMQRYVQNFRAIENIQISHHIAIRGLAASWIEVPVIVGSLRPFSQHKTTFIDHNHYLEIWYRLWYMFNHDNYAFVYIYIYIYIYTSHLVHLIFDTWQTQI